VIEEENLPIYVCNAVDTLKIEGEFTGDYNEIVVCRILDDVHGTPIDAWVQEQIKIKKESQDKSEYEEYLRLKAKFETK
jgi:hypothetical protein